MRKKTAIVFVGVISAFFAWGRAFASQKVNPVRESSLTVFADRGTKPPSTSISFPPPAKSVAFSNRVNIATIDDYIIGPVVEEYISSAIKKSEEQNAYLIIQLNTPGGLLKSTQNIVKDMLNSSVPIIVYIAPQGARAASAGTFISYAASLIAMAPSTHIGAAHPVLGGGRWGNLSKEMKEKILNDTLAWAKSIAQKRGRPYSFIRKAVKESISITEKEALKRKIIDLEAGSLEQLIEKIDGRQVTLADGRKIKLSTKGSCRKFIDFNLRYKLLNTLVNPNIAYLLFTFGFLGLIFEFTHPGFGFPGIMGVISLILAFYAFQVLPVNYAGAVLLALGILFFIIEAFTPAFGLFTLGGIFCFILGSVMFFRDKFVFAVGWNFILPVAGAISLWSIFILTKVVQARVKKPLVGKEGLIGSRAEVIEDIAGGKGKVMIHGEIWRAKSRQDIKKGSEVVVDKVDGLVLWVKPLDGD